MQEWDGKEYRHRKMPGVFIIALKTSSHLMRKTLECCVLFLAPKRQTNTNISLYSLSFHFHFLISPQPLLHHPITPPLHYSTSTLPHHSISSAHGMPSTSSAHGMPSTNASATTPAHDSKATDAAAHRYSRKTRVNYNGHVERALKYAGDLEDPEWKTSLTSLSVHTPKVLLAFIASKCEQSGYSYKQQRVSEAP